MNNKNDRDKKVTRYIRFIFILSLVLSIGIATANTRKINAEEQYKLNKSLEKNVDMSKLAIIK